MRRYFIIFLTCFPFCSMAQVKIGVRGGMNFSNIILHWDNNTKVTGAFIPRLSAGLTVEIPLNDKDNWFIYTAPYYSGKGAKMFPTVSGGKKDSETIHLNYIELPVTVACKFSAGNENRFVLGAGPYIGYGFNGEISWKGGRPEAEKHLHQKQEEKYKRLEAGFDLNSMYEIKSRWGMRFDYTASILNTHWPEEKQKNNVFGFSLFWYLNKKVKE